MNWKPREVESFAFLRSLDEFVRCRGLSIETPEAHDAFAAEVRKCLEDVRRPTLLYGMRTEGMFGYVAEALGNCAAVLREDDGPVRTPRVNLRRADYRLILNDRKQYLVEVKNHHQKKDPRQPVYFQRSYVETLLQYAEMVGQPLRIAVYWDRWNIWTLTCPSRLKRDGKQLVMSMTDAIDANEMVILGDCLISTAPPISLRLNFVRDGQRRINANEIVVQIESAEIRARHRELTDAEAQLAMYFLLYGGWTDIQQETSQDDDILRYVEFAAHPEGEGNFQGSYFLGWASGMMARQYKRLTSEDGKVVRLIPLVDPTHFEVPMTRLESSERLPICRFFIHGQDTGTMPQHLLAHAPTAEQRHALTALEDSTQ